MNIFGIVGWKNSGKTTLLSALVAEFVERGLTVSTVKHAHHNFDVDQSGTDSQRHRDAGAQEVVLSSSKRWAIMHENRRAEEATLPELLQNMAAVDLVLVEGYKAENHPKIETVIGENTKGFIADTDVSIRAIATDKPLPDANVPVLNINDIPAIAEFILQEINLA